MFRFENPSAFNYFYLLPVLLVIIFWTWKHQENRLNKAFNKRLKPLLTQTRSITKRKVKIVLELLVVSLTVVALARPQFGQSSQKVKSQGVELIVALDVSNSMLAEDIKPSRLAHAKNEISRLLSRLSGDKVGLIVFAGSAVLLSPMTNDYSALKLFLDSSSPDSVTTQGTEFKAAIDAALGALKRGGIENDDTTRVTRVLLIVTDGESTTGQALDAAKKALHEGVRIFTLGVGTRAGAPIPERDDQGSLKGYKKDRSGQTVMSAANEDALAQLAQAGGGAFYYSDFSGQAVESLKRDIDRMQKAEFETDFATNYDEKYQPILLTALLLALLELFLSDRKRQTHVWRGRFEVGPS